MATMCYVRWQVTQVEVTYDFRLPPQVKNLLQWFQFTLSLGVEFVPLDCLGSSGYRRHLIFWMAAPALAVLLVVVALFWRALRARKRIGQLLKQKSRSQEEEKKLQRLKQEWLAPDGSKDTIVDSIQRVLLMALPWILQIAFLCYPIVASQAFQAWACYDFADGRGWLVADVGIECYTSGYNSVKLIASVAVLLYPVGLFVLNAALLGYARRGIVSRGQGSDNRLSNALAFLYRVWLTITATHPMCLHLFVALTRTSAQEYEPQYYWWELVEMARRFVLVGLFIGWPAPRGTVMQLVVATLFCLVYLAIQNYAQPYAAPADDLLAMISSYMLTLFMVTCLILKYVEVTHVSELQNQMSNEMRSDYLVDATTIATFMVLCVLTTLIFGVLIFFAQVHRERRYVLARRLRHDHDRSEVAAPKLVNLRYHLFLSQWAGTTRTCHVRLHLSSTHL